MIEDLFVFESTRLRQREAPLLKEREEYLSHLLDDGLDIRWVRSVASMLLHIVRLMEMKTLRLVEATEIQQASQRWLTSNEFRKSTPSRGDWSDVTFATIATKWLSFHNQLKQSEIKRNPAELISFEFNQFLRSSKGMSAQTAYTYYNRSLHFLRWVLPRCEQFSLISAKDVDDFIEIKRAEKCLPRTIASYCAVFRCLFRYAGARGWIDPQIVRLIKSPRISRYDDAPRGPEWRDVRRMLNLDLGMKPANLRAAAVAALCAIYAMRSGEVIALQVDDFDWTNEILTIRRAKGGRIQQYPIAFEVGEKILRYVKFARPQRSLCRNLFVTLKPPYRPIQSSSLWKMVADPLKSLGVSSNHYGAHSLRHSCATHLLRTGSGLQDVADFLGHRGLGSVSIYAKHDTRSLRQVAAFSLRSVV